MVSPNLLKKELKSKALEPNEDAKRLFQAIYQDISQHQTENQSDESPKITVSELVSKVAFFYEKLRNAIDYDEDHLLRKNAIIRIMRRQVMIEGVLKGASAEELSKHLLVELIRGAYLPNGKVPATKIGEIAIMLEKYLVLKSKIMAKIDEEIGLRKDITKADQMIKRKNAAISWIMSLAACEIEESLGQNQVKQAVVVNMFNWLRKHVEFSSDMPDCEDKDIQLYLSVCRNYLKYDEDMLSFVLFKYYNDNWSDGDGPEADEEMIGKIADIMPRLQEEISRQLEYPFKNKIDKVVKKYSLYCTILTETIDGDPAKVYNELRQDEKLFNAAASKVCNGKYKKTKAKLWRAAVRSIIYIFLTKSIFVLLIEIPAIKFFGEPLNPVSLAINISFPAVFLFVLVAFSRTPGQANTEKIIGGIKELSFVGHERNQPIFINGKTKRAWLVNAIFNLLYVATFFVSTYLIIKFLNLLDFTWVSVIIFLFFLAFVSFFSVLVTKNIKDLIVVEKKENIFTFLIDLFYMPVIVTGRWLSRNISKVNIFVFIFDFIIEAPFKVLVDVADDWTRYIKERKDNVI
jgi:hypothetical protein